jgi:hypothetical protein
LQNNDPAVQKLDLEDNNVGAERLAHALTTNSILEELDWEDSNIGDDDAKCLTKINLRRTTHYSGYLLDDNNIGDCTISGVIWQPTLSENTSDC